MYEAVVFDVDGVLLRPPERSDPIRNAIESAFGTFDVEPSVSDVDLFYSGTGETVERIGRVCDRHGLELETFWPELERHVTELQVRMIERGERDLYNDHTVVTTLSTTVDLALVSNNTHATIEFMVDHFNVGDHFETMYGREPTVDGYRRRKPDPHYIERALNDLDTRSALLVGDSPTDVVAADRAGLDSVLVRRDHRHSLDPVDEPTYIIDQLTELTEIL